MADGPLPTMTTVSGRLAQRLAEHRLDLFGGGLRALAPSTGIDTLVPPSKSIPKVKPRTSIAQQRDGHDQPR